MATVLPNYCDSLVQNLSMEFIRFLEELSSKKACELNPHNLDFLFSSIAEDNLEDLSLLISQWLMIEQNITSSEKQSFLHTYNAPKIARQAEHIFKAIFWPLFLKNEGGNPNLLPHTMDLGKLQQWMQSFQSKGKVETPVITFDYDRNDVKVLTGSAIALLEKFCEKDKLSLNYLDSNLLIQTSEDLSKTLSSEPELPANHPLHKHTQALSDFCSILKDFIAENSIKNSPNKKDCEQLQLPDYLELASNLIRGSFWSCVFETTKTKPLLIPSQISLGHVDQWCQNTPLENIEELNKHELLKEHTPFLQRALKEIQELFNLLDERFQSHANIPLTYLGLWGVKAIQHIWEKNQYIRSRVKIQKLGSDTLELFYEPYHTNLLTQKVLHYRQELSFYVYINKVNELLCKLSNSPKLGNGTTIQAALYFYVLENNIDSASKA